MMSVADMVDAGNDVYFLSSGEYYAIHRRTGTTTQFVRRKNVFEIDAEVPEYTPQSAQESTQPGSSSSGSFGRRQ